MVTSTLARPTRKIAQDRLRYSPSGPPVAGDPQAFDSKSAPLWSERIRVVLPSDHTLAARDIIYWTDLREQTVLPSHYDPGRELQDLLDAKLTSPEHRPRIERQDVSRGVVKSSIAVGFGTSLVLESDIGTSFFGLLYREYPLGPVETPIGLSERHARFHLQCPGGRY